MRSGIIPPCCFPLQGYYDGSNAIDALDEHMIFFFISAVT
jgi:hypothetical protein